MYINPDEVSHTVLICEVSFTLHYVVPYALRCHKTFIAICCRLLRVLSLYSGPVAGRGTCSSGLSVANPSVVCNVGAPYSGGWSFWNISSPPCTLAILWLPYKILRRYHGNPFVGGVKRKTLTRIRCTTSDFSRDFRPSSSIAHRHIHYKTDVSAFYTVIK